RTGREIGQAHRCACGFDSRRGTGPRNVAFEFRGTERGPRPLEVKVDFLRHPRERAKTSPVKEPVKEPEPLEAIEDVWTPAAQMPPVGILVLLLVAALYLIRPVLLPVVAAMVIGTTLAPIVKAAARHRVSPWVTAIALGIVLIVIAGIAVTLLAAP